MKEINCTTHHNACDCRELKFKIILAELEGALKFMTMPITSTELTVKNLLTTIANDTKRGKEALQKLKEFMGGECK